MKALVFGANGQDGHYLNKLLSNYGIKSLSISRNNAIEQPTHIKGDITDLDLVERIIQLENPGYIFHLAANSTTRHDALFENHQTISTGTLNILESVKKYASHSKVFITGSGVQFKNTGIPIKETDEFQANSAYAIARIQSVYAARYYRSLGIKTYVGYLFHHESPLRKEHHVAKVITEHAKKIASGENIKITLGDISVKKEWAYAGDIVEGIYKLVTQDVIAEASIGTGQGYSIQDWLEVCFGLINRNWKDYVEVTGSVYQPEYNTLISNSDTINALGWSPKTSLQELAKKMIFNKIA